MSTSTALSAHGSEAHRLEGHVELKGVFLNTITNIFRKGPTLKSRKNCEIQFLRDNLYWNTEIFLSLLWSVYRLTPLNSTGLFLSTLYSVL